MLLLPALAAALEPRFDHRDQAGPSAEFLVLKDVLFSGSTEASSVWRGAVRVAWGFDPAGDGDEIFIGTTLSVVDWEGTSDDRVNVAADVRYRVCMGTEELKTIFDVGIWGAALNRFAIGPQVGAGVIYDFNRNFGLFGSIFLAAAIGEVRIVSFGGGLGAQYRFE